MKKTYTVGVTQEDIDSGLRFQPGLCPVARAMRRILGFENVIVWQGGFYFGEVPVAHTLPEEASRFISEFDRERPVEPFSFQVEVP